MRFRCCLLLGMYCIIDNEKAQRFWEVRSVTKLEFVRRITGLSQTELGRRIGVSPTNIVLVERGHRKPWPKLRRQLAEALGVPENELFDAEGWPLKAELAEPQRL